MGTTSFKYSKAFACLAICWITICIGLFLFFGIACNEVKLRLFAGIFLLIFIMMFVYFFWNHVRSAFRNETAIEFDEEKVSIYMTGRTVYWKDVVEVSWEYDKWKFLLFEVVDGKNITVGVGRIAGANKTIYNTAQDYFRQALLNEGN
ncbi:hypothetical protein [Mucilaginibacter lappiensis]|uniref:hypothetical protein n=1 Tax=Mucilaginibacter lappiensis TaxID=354630 RepID=UPI003D21ECBE